MVGRSHLESLGIFVREAFLPEPLCQVLCGGVDNKLFVSGDVWAPENGLRVDENIKRRREVSCSVDTEPELHRRLFEISGDLAEAFGLELRTIQPLKFTRYDVGDFYKPHRDVVDDPSAPDMIRDRKLAITLFLNQQADEPIEGDYCGGHLTFFGLADDSLWQNVGMPLDSEAGMLVAFRPDVIHEVTPVTHGKRYAITTWLS